MCSLRAVTPAAGSPGSLADSVRRTVAAGAAAVLSLSALACTADDDDVAGADHPGAPAGESGDSGAVPPWPYRVGQHDLVLVDPARDTDAVPDRELPARPDRTLEVRVMYPTEGPAGPEPSVSEPPESVVVDGDVIDAEGVGDSFPLVVIAHGFNGHPENFHGWAAHLAREGYVVAVPRFPLSNGDVGVLDDVQQQPGDVSFIIDELGDLGPDDLLGGHVDVDQVAVLGHSLGAVTALGVTFNSCCADERVDAAIPISGGPLPFDGGTYDPMPPVPMLVAHGAADELVPVAIGDAVLDMATGPTWYLRTTGADHTSVLFGENGDLLAEATLAFLDATLRDDDEALAAMGDVVEASGLGEWRTAGTGETDLTGDTGTSDG